MRSQLFNHHSYSFRALVFQPVPLLPVLHSTKAQGDREDAERNKLMREAR